ncbi:winged helix-turn-helix transcriptional regulator [Candidatus Uhrbacteria bacterium]|jgi:predicted transcriptional regulator|nr:winged helix-turn-helix transcriptional regulator [Candidatus Uhrbacteria bacterium]
MKNLKGQIELMKVLANKNRLSILHLLMNTKTELCVNQIADRVGISQSLASQSLKYLALKKILKGKRNGQTICYMPESNKEAKQIFKLVNILNS